MALPARPIENRGHKSGYFPNTRDAAAGRKKLSCTPTTWLRLAPSRIRSQDRRRQRGERSDHGTTQTAPPSSKLVPRRR